MCNIVLISKNTKPCPKSTNRRYIKMRYVCLDTNIFIACALLTGREHIPEHLQSFKMTVENHDIKFLLPEIIESEFEGILEEKKKEITKQLKELQETIGNKNLISSHDENKLQEEIRELKKNREESLEETQKYIEELFSHSNCIKIPLTSEILVKSYIRQIRNLKPFIKEDYSKNRPLPIDADCVIIESLKEYLIEHSSSDDVLYFCAIDSDFYKNDSPHPDIEDELHLQLYMFKNLSELLESLGEEISEQEKEQLSKVQERITMPMEQMRQIQEALQEIVRKQIQLKDFSLPQDKFQQLHDAMQMSLPQDRIQQLYDAMQMSLPKDRIQQIYDAMSQFQQLHEESEEGEEKEQDENDNNENKSENEG